MKFVTEVYEKNDTDRVDPLFLMKSEDPFTLFEEGDIVFMPYFDVQTKFVLTALEHYVTEDKIKSIFTARNYDE